MQEPQTRTFIGGINYYRMMLPQLTHVLAPLLELSVDAPFVREPRQEQAFKEINALLMHDCLNAYPDLNCLSTSTGMRVIINWLRLLYRTVDLLLITVAG